MKIIVLDTETLGLENPTIYDVGYIIYDTELKAKIKEKSYVIKQVFDNELLMQSAYYYKKKPLYIERLKSGYTKKVGWGSLVNYLKKDIEKYNISFVGAFNSRFDYRAFAKTCALFNKVNPLANLDPVANDIMNYIKVIVDTPDYLKFCQDNGFMTKHAKPRPQKKAETVYSYLTKNVEYEEEHTGLEDSKIELEILIECRLRLGLD